MSGTSYTELDVPTDSIDVLIGLADYDSDEEAVQDAQLIAAPIVALELAKQATHLRAVGFADAAAVVYARAVEFDPTL